jgi:hypothetical protein
MKDMKSVNQCTRADRVYNAGEGCHTMAINVGLHAECNTFNMGSQKAGFKDISGGIGACQALDCTYNDQLECRVPGIQVDGHAMHADCETYRPPELNNPSCWLSGVRLISPTISSDQFVNSPDTLKTPGGLT